MEGRKISRAAVYILYKCTEFKYGCDGSRIRVIQKRGREEFKEALSSIYEGNNICDKIQARIAREQERGTTREYIILLWQNMRYIASICKFIALNIPSLEARNI